MNAIHKLDWIKALLGGLVLCAALFWAFHTVFHYVEVQLWPQAPAICTESVVTSRSSGRNASWIASVQYSYTVNKHQYQGNDQIVSNFPWEAEMFSKDFPTGAHFQVRYNPAKVEESSLGWWLRPLILFLIIAPSTLIVAYYAIPAFLPDKNAQRR